MTSMNILIVDDDDTFRKTLSSAFQRRGYRVKEARSYDSALEVIRGFNPVFAVLDLRMPGNSGLDLLRELLELYPDIKAVVLTGYGSITTALEAVRIGAVHYLTKPATVDDIIAGFGGEPVGVANDDSPTRDVPTLERVEWEHINRVLSDCGGNISKAAELLGIHRRSLQRKLAKNPFVKNRLA